MSEGTPFLRADATDDEGTEPFEDDPELQEPVKRLVCAICEFPAGTCGHSPALQKEI